jgi:hypothetical protein
LNNLIDHPQKEEYKNNFLELKKYVLIGSDSDEVIKPWNSIFWGFYGFF